MVKSPIRPRRISTSSWQPDWAQVWSVAANSWRLEEWHWTQRSPSSSGSSDSMWTR